MAREHKTFFGKLLAAIFDNHQSAEEIEDAVRKAYEDLAHEEKISVEKASGYIAIINQNIEKAPDEIFTLIQQVFPDVTKENVTDFLSGIVTKLKIADDYVPQSFDGALQLLQEYMKKFEGNTWATIVKAVVTIGTEVLNPNIGMIQKVDFVLEHVYQDIIKPLLAKKSKAELPEPAGIQ